MDIRTIPILLFSLIVVVAGCATNHATNHDVAIKIEKSPNDFKILKGEFDGSLALIHGNPKNATIHVTDGSYSCEGTSNTGTFSTDFIKNKVTHLFNFVCDGGATGQVILKITMYGNGNTHGAGIGTLSDGSKIKVFVGDMAGTLGW